MTALKPWREVIVPHPDVLKRTFQQSEFAADISAGRNKKAPLEYREAAPFFARTYVTEGMRLLLTQVAQRLAGAGGEPVIQLQTAFGGGKTHTMLAVYHLATRSVPVAELPGVAAILDRAGLMELPTARVAILDGTARGPNETVKYGKREVHTLWGDLAWQLGGADAYARVEASDRAGTSPGKDVLREVLAEAAPCVVLIDELVAYVRQFPENQQLSGGSYNSNLSFVQALTEAAKQVPNAVILASLPESDNEVGDSRGKIALGALEKVFGRVQALWKPITPHEGFEIVRRRLFEPVRDEAAREAVCRAFFDLYKAEDTRIPSETRESRYLDELRAAYPIHPEVFERLYADWSSLPQFQRTRGVLKLMAHVIAHLWSDGSKDLMILPGNIPLKDAATRNELTALLPAGWDPVIERDIDGDRADAVGVDANETRFGTLQAARRVARTVFLGSAPSSSPTVQGQRGIDRARLLLGCLQPGESSAVFSDALNRLADRLHYLNASGERDGEGTRYWFDVRANLRREMEERKARLDERNDLRPRMAQILAILLQSRGSFDALHVFTAHADIPDDGALRLVVLSPDTPYSKQDPSIAAEAVEAYTRQNGLKSRFRGNRLVFLAPDAGSLGRFRDAVRTEIAWRSIVDDVKHGRLNIDQLQQRQAEREVESSETVSRRAARDSFRWVLAPTQATPAAPITLDAYPISASATSSNGEIDRVCIENELVIPRWSPMHLRSRLRELYWREGSTAVLAKTVWDDFQKYLYLPRLKSREVLEATIREGARGTDLFGTALGRDGDRFEGLRLGTGAEGVSLHDTLLLVEPAAAKAILDAEAEAARQPPPGETPDEPREPGRDRFPPPGLPPGRPGGDDPPEKRPQAAMRFHGAVEVSATAARMKLMTLADEIIALLAQDPNATVTVTLEIDAEFPGGAKEHIKRAVSENAAQLGFKVREWE